MAKPKPTRPKRRFSLEPDAPISEVRKALSCTGKKAYVSISIAKEAAKDFRKRVGPRTKPYKCKYCPSYHIGHYRKRHKTTENINAIQTIQRQDTIRI